MIAIPSEYIPATFYLKLLITFLVYEIILFVSTYYNNTE